MHMLPLVVHRHVWLWLVLAAATLWLGALAVAAQGPQPQGPEAALGTGFTYQGLLKNSGAPVNGACDIAFRLYDAASGGAQVGSALTQTVPITNGLFTTALDFGQGMFNGSARFLDMQVRCPSGSGNHTALSPRQALTAAPYALALPGVYQQQSPFFVGIGRTTPINFAEFFGVLAPVSSGFGGMYVRTTGVTAKPYYGYDTNGGPRAFHYLDGPTGDWKLDVGGADRLTVQPNGNIGIGTGTPSERLTVQTATANYGIIHTDGTITVGTWIGAGAINPAGGWIGTQSNHPLHFFVNNGDASMTINTNGSIVIGTNSQVKPQRLVVHGPDTSGSTEVFRVEDKNGSGILTTYDDGTVGIGALLPNTTTHACFSGLVHQFAGCSSAAEYVPTIDDGAGFAEAADLVSLAPAVQNPYDDAHAPFVVKKSDQACDSNLLGFIVNPESGADGKKLNEHYLPLAIFGYFPAKVTLENGAIRRGDALTFASKPGYAMKATQACKIIGYALEDADQEGVIQVFANHGDTAAAEVAALRARVQSQAERLAAQQAQIDALVARLTALEHSVASSDAPTPAGQ